jgi:protein SCO1/2
MRRRGPDLRLLPGPRALPAIAVLAVALATAGCSGSKSHNRLAGSEFHAEGVLSPPRPAPPLALRDYRGRPVNIAAYRGKAVLVTFLYTHCPDVCPLIASNLGVALHLMGPRAASKARIIAVSVDPSGDTPRAVATFLARRRVAGRIDYLIGSASQLARVWQAWGVGSERDKGNPELVNHSGLIYGITGSGKQATIYAANFHPADVAHDVPLLAAH